jgi:hypothetical protein
MAGNQVILTFAGDSADLDRTLSQVGGRLDRFGNQTESATSRAGTGFRNAGESLRNFGTRATAFVSVPIVAGLFAAQQASSNLAEAQNATNVVFGEAASIISRAAETAATSMGLSERAFREAVTPMGAMLANLGFSQEEAANKAVMLSQRAADMASVFNTDVGTALEAINSGLRGEADPLEQFGVGLNEAAVNAKGMEMGLADSTGALTDNEKMQARLALIMDQTNGIAGDFAATSGEAANQERIMAAEAENAAAQFGDNLQPVMNKLMGIAGGLLEKFNGLSPGMQQLILYAGLLLVAIGPLATVIGGLSTIMGVFAGMTWAAVAPILIIILVIAALIAIVVLLVIHWDTIKNAAGIAWNFIKEKAMQAYNWIKDNWPLILAILTGPIGLAVLAIVRNWDRIKAGFTAVKDWISARVGDIVSFITGIPGRIAGAATRLGSLIKDGISAAARFVSDKVGDIIDFIQSIPERIGNIGGAIKDKITGGLGSIAGAVGGLLGFDTGGIVPGPRGAAQLAVVHGGETIVPTHDMGAMQRLSDTPRGAGVGSSTVVNLYVQGSIVTERDIIRMVRDEIINGGLRGLAS